MDIGNLMAMIKRPPTADLSSSGSAANDRWLSESSYDIPRGRVSAVKELSTSSGMGWSAQTSRQESIMSQVLEDTRLNGSIGANKALPPALPKVSSAKLLNELDQLASLLGTDFDKTKLNLNSNGSDLHSQSGPVISSSKGMAFQQALLTGLLNKSSGMFTDSSGTAYTLRDALEKDLINPDSVVFISPKDGRPVSLRVAIQHGYMQRTGHYLDPQTGKRLRLEECLNRGLVMPRDTETVEITSVPQNTHVDTAEFYVDQVKDPLTGDWLSVNLAVDRGIFDPAKGMYFNMKTGELLKASEALQKGLITAGAKPYQATSANSSQENSVPMHPQLLRHGVTSAIHPVLKKWMSVSEAINEGILDRSSGLYVDTVSNKKYRIEEAIQKGLVVTEESSEPHGVTATVTGTGDSAVSINHVGIPFSSDSLAYQNMDENAFTLASGRSELKMDVPPPTAESMVAVIAVHHPITKELLTNSKATELGILSGGYYVDITTGRSVSLHEAVELGLAVAESGASPREKRDKKVSSLHLDDEEEESWTVVEEVKTETKKWVITSVIDPRTKQEISFDDAVLQGVLDQAQGRYINPTTREEMSIDQAIEKSLIVGELVSVNTDAGQYSSSQASIDDIEVCHPETQKIIPFDMAVKAGLIDVDAKTFYNPVTKQWLSLLEAENRGFIKRKKKAELDAVKQEVKLQSENASSEHLERSPFLRRQNLSERLAAIQFGSESDITRRSDLGEMKTSTNRSDSIISFGDIDATMRVEETKTLITNYIENPKTVVPSITPARDRSSPTHTKPDANLLARVDAVLDKAKLYAQESSLSLEDFSIDWSNDRVTNKKTAEVLTLAEAVNRGIVNQQQVDEMTKHNWPTQRSISSSIAVVPSQAAEVFQAANAKKTTNIDNRVSTISEQILSRKAVVTSDKMPATRYNLFENQSSSASSTTRKPETQTEVKIQEFRTEQTFKLDNQKRADVSEAVAGDKVLVPKPFESKQRSGDTIKQSYIPPALPVTAISNQRTTKVIEEKVEITENKPARKVRAPIDDISATEFFTKGEQLQIDVDDENPLDNFEVNLKTRRPGTIDWELDILAKAATQQKVTKVVEEVIEEVHGSNGGHEKEHEVSLPVLQKTPISAQPSPAPVHMQVTEEVYETIDAPVRGAAVVPENKSQSSSPASSTKTQMLSPDPQPSVHVAPAQRIKDREIIIIEKDIGSVIKNIAINMSTALEQGYVNLGKREFTHPMTGETFSLADAIRLGYIQGSSDEIKSAVTKHTERIKANRPIMEYSTTKEFSSVVEKEPSGMEVAEALSGNNLNVQTGQFTVPNSRVVLSLRDAVLRGLLDGATACFTNPGNKKTCSLTQALEARQLDDFGRWISPLTGKQQNLSEAIKKNLVTMVSSEQTINKVTTITEVKKVMVDHVVHPVTMETIDYNTALLEGVISTVDGVYRSPVTGDSLTLDEAIRLGLICGELIDTKRRTEDKVVDSTRLVTQTPGAPPKNAAAETTSYESTLHVIRSPAKSFVIDTVVHPHTKSLISASQAIRLGFIEPATATYVSASGERLTFEEAIRQGLLQCLETAVSAATSCAAANGKSVSSSRDEVDEAVTQATFTEHRNYTITHAKDTTTGKNLTIKEAIKKGILDQDGSTFKDLATGKLYSTQEAIDGGFLVATLEDPNNPASSTDESASITTTKVYNIEAVVDPLSQQPVSPSEAVRRGIIDQVTGDYVNLDTMESVSMPTAITRGLVHANPIPISDTISFSIASVTDPKTGDQMSVSEALRHGFLDRSRKYFCNAHTGEKFSLEDAQQRGWVLVKSNYGSQRLSPTVTSVKGTMPFHPAGFQAFTILSVQDTRAGHEVPVHTAIARGILDSSRKIFKDTTSGEQMNISQAIRRNLIKLAPSVPLSTSSKVTFNEALRRGHLNPSTCKYTCPSTGQILSVDEAVRRGKLVDETGEQFLTENRGKVTNSQSTSFETALRQGLIDRNSGQFRNPDSGEQMPLSRAVLQGHVTPKTQWRAYSVPGLRSLSMNGPLSPSSRTTVSVQKVEPLYSTVNKARNVSSTTQLPISPPGGHALDIHVARNRGLINYVTGEVTLPQYGTSMLLDDALLQGLVTTFAPLNMLLQRNHSMNSLALHEAFQRGLVNPTTLAVRNPDTGQIVSFEDALVSGLLHPRPSAVSSTPNDEVFIREGSVSRDVARSRAGSLASSVVRRERDGSLTRVSTNTQGHPVNRLSSAPNGHADSRTYSYKKTFQQTTAKPSKASLSPNYMSNSRGHMSSKERVPASGGLVGGIIYKSGTDLSTRPEQTVGRPYAHGIHGDTISTSPLRGDAHFINGKLYASKPGFNIEESGMVVDAQTGEAMSLQLAERLNIVRRIPDTEHQGSYVPAANIMFNRDPSPVILAAVAPNNQSKPGAGSNSIALAFCKPFPVALPNAKQELSAGPLESDYAEIRH